MHQTTDRSISGRTDRISIRPLLQHLREVALEMEQPNTPELAAHFEGFTGHAATPDIEERILIPVVLQAKIAREKGKTMITAPALTLRDLRESLQDLNVAELEELQIAINCELIDRQMKEAHKEEAPAADDSGRSDSAINLVNIISQLKAETQKMEQPNEVKVSRRFEELTGYEVDKDILINVIRPIVIERLKQIDPTGKQYCGRNGWKALDAE